MEGQTQKTHIYCFLNHMRPMTRKQSKCTLFQKIESSFKTSTISNYAKKNKKLNKLYCGLKGLWVHFQTIKKKNYVISSQKWSDHQLLHQKIVRKQRRPLLLLRTFGDNGKSSSKKPGHLKWSSTLDKKKNIYIYIYIYIYNVLDYL